MNNSTATLPTEDTTGRYSVGQLVKATLLTSHGMKDRDRLALVAIVAHGNGMGFAEPSTAGLAEYVGVSERTMHAILKRLVAAGKILATVRKGARTLYRITREAAAVILSRLTRNPRNIDQAPPQKQATSTAANTGKSADEVDFEVPPGEENLSRSRATLVPSTENQDQNQAPKRRRKGRWFGGNHDNRPGWFNGKPIRPTTAERCPVVGHENYFRRADGGCAGCVVDADQAVKICREWSRDQESTDQAPAAVAAPEVRYVTTRDRMTLAERLAVIEARNATFRAAGLS